MDFDYHTHTTYSDGGKMRRMVRAAEELNTVLTALSSLQTHESLLFGAGTQAYQKVYGKH